MADRADSAAMQNRVLQVLALVQGTWELDVLVDVSKRPRKSVLMALGKLLRAGLVELIRPQSALTHDAKGRITANATPCPQYRVTPAGQKFYRTGKRIASGPKGPLTGARQRRTLKETFRARLWAALRMKGKATVPDLVEIARRPSDRGDVANNAQLYLRRLVKAGVAVELKTRASGFAPTSPGFKRFALTRDLGPQPPLAARTHLFDPNSGTRIEYRDASLPPGRRGTCGGGSPPRNAASAFSSAKSSRSHKEG